MRLDEIIFVHQQSDKDTQLEKIERLERCAASTVNFFFWAPPSPRPPR